MARGTKSVPLYNFILILTIARTSPVAHSLTQFGSIAVRCLRFCFLPFIPGLAAGIFLQQFTQPRSGLVQLRFRIAHRTVHDVRNLVVLVALHEIADIMDCSVGNSKSQLHKARTRLRELLQEDARSQARDERQEAKAQAPNRD